MDEEDTRDINISNLSIKVGEHRRKCVVQFFIVICIRTANNRSDISLVFITSYRILYVYTPPIVRAVVCVSLSTACVSLKWRK